MKSTSWAICSSSYGLLLGAPENWRESQTAPPNINIFILLSSLTARGRPNHAYSINKRHAQCTQVSVSIHTHPQIPWQKLFVLTRACKRNRGKTNKHGQRWRMKKEMFQKGEKSGWQRTKRQEKNCNSTWAHTHKHTRQFWASPRHPGLTKVICTIGANASLFHSAADSSSRQTQCWCLSSVPTICHDDVMQTQGDAEPNRWRKKNIHCSTWRRNIRNEQNINDQK